MNKYLILALGILALSSCKKEDHNELINQTTTQEISEADKAIEQKILAFKEDVASNTKDGGKISIDEALWNMEAALNYTYCMGAGAAVDPESEETLIEFTANANGQLDFDAVANAYMNLANQYQAAEELLIAEGKEYKLVDITNISTPEQLAEGKIMFKITALSDFLNDNITARLKDIEVFGPQDNWYWGRGIGRADGQFVGYDATIKFHSYINNYDDNGNLIPKNILGGYHTDIEEEYIDWYKLKYTIYRTPNDIEDNLHDYMIFYKKKVVNAQHFNLVLKYIEPYDEMNYYVAKYREIKNLINTNMFPTKEFINCQVFGKQFPDDYELPLEQITEVWHEVRYRYGIKHTGQPR